MTELEKAASGLLYDANSDPALLEARAQTSDLCMDYNALRSSQKEEKNALLHTILGACVPDIVSRAFYANHNLVILDAAPVTIGDHVFIGPNCCISTAGHPFDVAQRNAGLEYAKPVTIGNNVWIGMGVQICPGVTIGDNAVIGAGSVVTEDIPAGMLAIGVPCKAVKQVANKPQRRIL